MGEDCLTLAPLGVGDVATTPGYSLHAEHVIHAVPPRVSADRGALEGTYHRVLGEVKERG